MPTAHITSTDPLGLAGGAIVLKNVTGGARKDYHESINYNGKWIIGSVQILKPTTVYSITYELHTGASLVVPFGVAVNTDYLVTAYSASCSADARPTVTVSCVKPSTAAKIKAYGTPISITLAGGFGVVELWGATTAGLGADVISSSASISFQSLEASHATDGDYLDGGLYHYGFKGEYSLEAYSAITIPVAAHGNPEVDKAEGADAWQTHSTNWWKYLDGVSL